MNNILIATDFSPAARCATRYGLKLAAALNAKVSFATAYETLPIPVPDDPMMVLPGDMEDLVREQLTEEAKLFAVPGLRPIDTFSREGLTTDAVLGTATNLSADLIIVGMKEHGKGFRRVFGSTVTSLANKTNFPLLIVPEGTEYSPPAGIVIASDFIPNAGIGIPLFLHNLAAAFQSRITVIRFMRDRAAEVIEILDYSANLRRITGVIYPLEELPAQGRAEDRLVGYLEEHHCNLLAMSIHRQMLAERWLAGSPSRGLIFKTRVPFLLLPEERQERLVESP